MQNLYTSLFVFVFSINSSKNKNEAEKLFILDNKHTEYKIIEWSEILIE